MDTSSNRIYRQCRAPLSQRSPRSLSRWQRNQNKIKEIFGNEPAYTDIPGLCKVATFKEINAQGWSLNPGRYVGVAPGEDVSDEDFKTLFETLNEELETLNAQARTLEQTIAMNIAAILGT